MTTPRPIAFTLLTGLAAAAAAGCLPHYSGAAPRGRATRHGREATEPAAKREAGGDIALTNLARALGARLRPNHGLPIAELVRDEILDECRAGAAPHDLMLAVDTTGSMGGYITELRALGGALADAVKAGCRVGLIDYRDAGDEWVVRVVAELGTAPEIVTKSLVGLGWGGGGDWPEALLSALDAATARMDADALLGRVIVVTDAPSHTDERAEARVKRRLAAGRIAITIVAVSGELDPVEERSRTGIAGGPAGTGAVPGGLGTPDGGVAPGPAAAGPGGAVPAPARPGPAARPTSLADALRAAHVELRAAANPAAAAVAARTWLALSAAGRAATLDVALVVDETVPGLAAALEPPAEEAAGAGLRGPIVPAAPTGPAALPELLAALRRAGARATIIGTKPPAAGEEWRVVAPLAPAASGEPPGAPEASGLVEASGAPPLWAVLARVAALPWDPGRVPLCVLLLRETTVAPRADPDAERRVRSWVAAGARVLVVTAGAW